MDDPTSGLQNLALLLTVFSPALALVVVGFRTYGRVSSRLFGWDDGFILVAMVLGIGQTYVTWMYIKLNYIGIHIVDVPEHDPVPGLKYTYWVPVLYNPILAIVKNSMLIFLLRLTGSRDTIRYSIIVLIVINTTSMIAIFLTLIFKCTPITYNWDNTVNGGHCIKEGVFYISSACVTIITDFLVLAIPLWIVMGLRMAKRLKIAVIAIFFLGGIVTAVSIGRVVILVRAFFYPDHFSNVAFTISSIEINLAIVTASVPHLRPLLKRWFPRLFGAPETWVYEDAHAGPNNYVTKASTRLSVTTRKRLSLSGERFRLRNAQGFAEIPHKNRTESEVEIMAADGIMKTTNFSARYAEREQWRVDTESNKNETIDYGMRTSMESL